MGFHMSPSKRETPAERKPWVSKPVTHRFGRVLRLHFASRMSLNVQPLNKNTDEAWFLLVTTEDIVTQSHSPCLCHLGCLTDN